jgi:hypothetical protein
VNSSKRSTKDESGSKNGRTSGIIPKACLHRNRGILWMAGTVVALAALSFVPASTGGATKDGLLNWLSPAAEAQNFSQRTIQGKVVDDTGTPVQAATVFLKNDKTRNVKSFTSTADGSFRFAQVGMVDDYDVWAEHAGHKSPVKTVSAFNSSKEVDFELKLK